MTQHERNSKIEDLCTAMENWDLDTLIVWAQETRRELLIKADDDTIQAEWEAEVE